MKVKGLLRLKRCMISTKLDLDDAKVVVVEDLKGLSCLVGRDWIGKIPHLKDSYKEQVELIRKMKTDLQEALSKGQTFEKIRLGQEIMAVQESESIDNIDKLTELRTELYDKLKEIAAETIMDIKPLENTKVKFEIELINPYQRPIACPSRRIPENLREKVRIKLEEFEKAGIIRRSKSPWSFPLRIVGKPDGSVRITVDYKPLNKVIKIPQYPAPYIPDYFNKLGKAKFFSKIDLKEAYYQIPNAESAIEFTAFICEHGHYKYLGMPMGISSAPAAFQSYMDEILKKFKIADTAFPYLDDVLIYNKELVEHVETVKDVIKTLKEGYL